MCKGNTIITSWSWVAAWIALIFLTVGILATGAGAQLTWGEIIFIPFVFGLFLNKKHYYFFSDSGFTVKYLFSKTNVTKEKIQQVDAFETKSGTWIVIKLHGAPEIASWAGRKELIGYYLRNRKNCFLIQLRWGERDKAMEILRESFPDKIMVQP